MAGFDFASSVPPGIAAEAELTARGFMLLTGLEQADPEALGIAIGRLKAVLATLTPVGDWDEPTSRISYAVARHRAALAFPDLGLYAAPDPDTIDGEPSVQDAVDDLAILIQEIDAALQLYEQGKPQAGLAALVDGFHERWRGHLEGLTFALETRDGLF